MVGPQVAISNNDNASRDVLLHKNYGPKLSTTSKRKRDAKGSRNVRRKRVKSLTSLEESREWQHQYWQGKIISELPSGLGSGGYLLGSPLVPSQSPVDGKVRFELMSGTGGAGDGSIRLCASDDYWLSEPSEMQPIFLVPVAHIEQIFVLQNPSPSVPKTQVYQIIIVPTAATGSSPIIRQSPEIISFNWPDKKADKHLKGKLGEAADKEKDTYLSVFKRVFNEQLAPLGKSVVRVQDNDEEDQTFSCSASVLFRRKLEDEESNFHGRVYFLDTGVLLSSKMMRLYLPFKSLAKTVMVLARDKAFYSDSPVSVGEKGRPVSLEVHIETSEPYYEKGDTSEPNAKRSSQDPMLLSFTKISVELFDKLKAYASKHDVDFTEHEQEYYDFASNLPATGWNPVT